MDGRNKISGICLSIGLHVTAALLLLGIPGQAMLSQNPLKLDLMWVTVAGKDARASAPAAKPVAPRQEPQEQARTASDAPRLTAPDRPEEPPRSAMSYPAEVKPVAVASAKADEGAKQEKAAKQSASGGLTGHGKGEAGAVTRALPLYRENPPPGYPAIARQRGYEGIVLVEAEILPDGRVGSAEIRKTSGYAILDSAALSAVKGWKFEPARKSGIPCKTKAELPIRFILNENRSAS